MVDGEVALLEDGSQLKLIGSHLVVARLYGNGQLQGLNLQVLHKGLHTIRDGAKVVVVHLLVFGTLVTHQRTTCHQQVGTGRVESLVDEEIFLFPTQIDLNLGDVVVEQRAYIGSCLVDSVQSTQQGSLVVKCLTRISDKDGGNTQRVVNDKHRTGGVPG